MPAKEILFYQNARESLLKGVDTITQAVKVTLGPTGRNVLIERNFTAPTVTKDGVTVAKIIELEDKAENLGAQLIREVASKTNDDAGDGTTTAAVLAQAILKEGGKAIAAGYNAMDIKRGIDVAIVKAVSALVALSRPIKDHKEIEQIGTVSANNDAAIGKLIADAMEKTGKEGVISVEEGKSLETTLEVTEGIEFDSGYQSPYFATDPNTLNAYFDNPYILLASQKISTMNQILPLLEKVVQSGRPLVMLAEDFDQEAIAAMVVNKLQGTIKVSAAKAPEFGDRRKDMLEDLAVLTNGEVVSSEIGSSIEEVSLEQLGTAKRIIMTKDKTTIIGGAGDKKEIKARIEQIRKQMKAAPTDYDRDKLHERLAKLAAGVAIIHVGAATEIEMKEKKSRVEDAVAATKAAIAEGVVAGGGAALLRASHALIDIKLPAEQAIGVSIVRRAMSEPLRQIAANTGMEGAVIINRILEEKSPEFGYNAALDKFENLVEAGIIDPTKVVRCALQNATSIASLILTTDALIVEQPKKKRKVDPMADNMVGGPTLKY